jgi:CHAT domain-containing protein/tetratricopeptide (TPR) repeat protein
VRYFHLDRKLLYLLLWVTLPVTVVGQCPTTGQFLQQLHSIEALDYKDSKKIPQLYSWCKNWKKCGYARDSSYVRGLLQLSVAYLNKGALNAEDQPLLNDAARLSQKVIDLYDRPHPALLPNDLARAYYQQGVAFANLGLEEKGRVALQNAVLIADNDLAGKRLAANAHMHLVYAYWAKGDFQRAMTHAERGEKLARAIQNGAATARILIQKAQTLGQLNRNEEAIEALKEANELLKDNAGQQPSVASQYRMLGHLYQKKGQISEALASLNTAFRISRKNEYIPYDFATSLGYFYYELGNYPEALRYYQMALSMKPDPGSKANILDNIGVVYWKEARFGQALSVYQLGMAELLPAFKPTTLLQLPPAKAVRQSAEKLYLLSTIQDKADTWLDYYRKAQDASGKQKGKLLHAMNTYALADSMIDYMRYEHQGEGSRLFWRQKTHRMYERALEACYLAGATRQAFYFLEKSKAVLLADKLIELGANQQLSEPDMLKQSTLRKKIEELQAQLDVVSDQDERYLLQKQLDKTNDAFEQFRKRIEKTNPSYYRYRYDNHTPTLAEFRQNLGSPASGEGGDAAFVSYFVGDSTLYAFVLTQQQARLVRLAIPPARYEASAGEFLKLCSSRAYLNAHYARYQSLAHELYQQLWEPLQLTAQRVIVAPDGVFLPFEALLTRAGSDDFLLKQCAISYTYSARFLQTTTQGQKATYDHSFVGFAPENFKASTTLPSLRGSADALEAVGQPFWFGKSLINAEASKANFLRYAPGARVIQLFTHAAADSTDITEPRIYFHDAALSLSELKQGERFNAQLMVLSACETGVGTNQRGEGVFSLARSFAALGVPSTVTTLWTVENEPTYTLTELFHKYLHDGLPKDEALQRAKLDWLQAGSTTDDLPSQWAGIILVGDSSPLVGSRQQVAWIGGLAVALLAGAVWLRRRRFTVPAPAAGRP